MSINVGETLSFTRTVTPDMISNYAKVSGDYNPIHLNKVAAMDAGFPSEIAHGMLTMGMSTKLFFPFLEAGYIVVNHSTRFKGPLLVGGELRLEGSISEVKGDQVIMKLAGYMGEQEVIQGSVEFKRSLS
ncbi:MaoC family dehydratase [Bacillus sp. DJP31]|uniref:MaoC family dehydratase n=1 Tax=Bacillus sp. DJP31 TaxID=3409789 RepID=UPI003BB7AC64